MTQYNSSESSAYGNAPDDGAFVERYDAYVVSQAWQRVPRNIIRPEMLRDEVDDLVQTVRIKFWDASRKRHIANPKYYISRMMLFAVIDMVRRYHPALSLSYNDDGELYQDGVFDLCDESTQDLTCKLEQEEAFHESVLATGEAVLALPPRQRYAMICALKDHIDDVLPLMDMLRQNQIDIDEIHWPEDKSELQRLRASLSVARKKLNSPGKKWE